MIKLSGSVCIDAPAELVWARLAKLEDIELWSHLIKRATCLGVIDPKSNSITGTVNLTSFKETRVLSSGSETALTCVNEHDSCSTEIWRIRLTKFAIGSLGAMDRTFDEALRVLAEHQLRHGIRTLVLSVHEPSGDVVASVSMPGASSVAPYGRVDRATNSMVRFRTASS